MTLDTASPTTRAAATPVVTAGQRAAQVANTIAHRLFGQPVQPAAAQRIAVESTVTESEQARADLADKTAAEQALARIEAALADQQKQLDRLTEQLTNLERQVGDKGVAGGLRRVEASVQSVLRRLYLNSEELPFPKRLIAERFGVLSQNEEDGITQAIFRRIGTEHHRFVEIGAGINGGNSGFFALECGWSGLMVEASEERVAMLKSRFGPNVDAVAVWVTREGINELLEARGIRGEIDLMSIDIDGNDYWIFEAIDVCSPRVLIVEYNSVFGADRSVVVPYDPQFDRHTFKMKGLYYGASLAAWTKLAKSKGYRLVTTEPRGVNAYFIRDDVAPFIPACDVATAYRVQEKYDRGLRAAKTTIFAMIERARLRLVDLDSNLN